MKRLLALLLVAGLTLLCGCTFGGDEVSEVSEVSEPDGTEFAATTVYEDDILTFRVLSATRTETGMAYAAKLENKTGESIKVDLSAITVNGNQTDAALSETLEKNATADVTIAVPLAATDVAKSVGLHLAAASNERWWMNKLVSRDLMFYPVAQPTATATVTATTAAA